VSTVNETALEAALWFSAASLAIAVIDFTPSVRLEETQDQAPPPFAVAVQKVVPPCLTATVALTSAVPEIVGVALFVKLPPAGAVITGAAGGVVSTENVAPVESGPILPAASIARAVNVW